MSPPTSEMDLGEEHNRARRGLYTTTSRTSPDRLQNKHREFQKRISDDMIYIYTHTCSYPRTTKRTVLGSTKAPLSLSHDDPLTAVPSSAPHPNGRLQVFIDRRKLLYKETLRTLKHHIQTSVRVKENVPETKKAGGTTLKRAGKSK